MWRSGQVSGSASRHSGARTLSVVTVVFAGAPVRLSGPLRIAFHEGLRVACDHLDGPVPPGHALEYLDFLVGVTGADEPGGIACDVADYDQAAVVRDREAATNWMIRRCTRLRGFIWFTVAAMKMSRCGTW